MPTAILNVFAIRRSLVVTSALIVAISACAPAVRGAEPFKSRVTANWDNVFAALPPVLGGLGQANFAGMSQTTHLGRAAQRGNLALGAPLAPTVFPGSGSVTLTAANGDQLTFTYTGQLFADTGEGKGTFSFTGGTGRFAKAKGEGTFYALIDLSQPSNQAMIVVLDGQIAY